MPRPKEIEDAMNEAMEKHEIDPSQALRINDLPLEVIEAMQNKSNEILETIKDLDDDGEFFKNINKLVVSFSTNTDVNGYEGDIKEDYLEIKFAKYYSGDYIANLVNSVLNTIDTKLNREVIFSEEKAIKVLDAVDDIINTEINRVLDSRSAYDIWLADHKEVIGEELDEILTSVRDMVQSKFIPYLNLEDDSIRGDSDVTFRCVYGGFSIKSNSILDNYNSLFSLFDEIGIEVEKLDNNEKVVEKMNSFIDDFSEKVLYGECSHCPFCYYDKVKEDGMHCILDDNEAKKQILKDYKEKYPELFI